MMVSDDGQKLEIDCMAESAVALKAVEKILETHIEMFSRRETLSIEWHST